MHNQAEAHYTSADQLTWKTLFTRQIRAVTGNAYTSFIPGLHALNFTESRIPELKQINIRLSKLSGWTIYAVPGLIDNRFFFRKMYGKKFGATTWIRSPSQLDYLEEPDMFHDVFGHIPLLTDPVITEYLFGLARIAEANQDNETVIEALARLYWYTIEFGLVRENKTLKIYGAGILSSIGETAYCLSGTPVLERFDIEKIIATPYIKDKYQEQYFVIDSMNELTAAIPVLEKMWI